MNAVLVSLLQDALEKGLLTVHEMAPGTFALKTHVMGMTFTLSRVRLSQEAS